MRAAFAEYEYIWWRNSLNTVNRRGMVWIVGELQSYSAAGGKHVAHQREKKSHD